MRTTYRFLLAAAVIAIAGHAGAQTPTPQTASPARTEPQTANQTQPDVGEIVFGARLNSTPAMGRFMRFDDLRSGATLERLHYVRSTSEWSADTNISNPGYRDQRYEASFTRYGRLNAFFEYNQNPLWFGDVERTPFREESPGVFRLNDTLQSAIENGLGTVTLYNSDLRDLDMRLRRDTLNGRFTYTVGRNLDLSAALTSFKHSGEQPWATPFAFSDDVIVPLNVDRRTNDFTLAAEWSNTRGMARMAYDGSWFNNNIPSVVWDNPLRFTDTNNSSAYSSGIGSSQGRMALAPDSTAHTVSGSGSFSLPRHSRVFAYVSVGTWLQNDQLLPFTINSSVPPIALPRETAEAKAVVTSTNLRYTTRPTNDTWFTASYRLYDFNNKSEPFPLTTIVRLDGTPAASPEAETEPFGYTRHFVDLDFSYTKFRWVALRAGYGLEHDDRTYRYVEKTSDNQVRASIDSSGLSWGSVRLQYDHSTRTGSGLDEEVLGDIGEQISLRQFDIADRNRDRVSAIVQYLPTSSVGLSATYMMGRERRPDSAFGLQDNDLSGATFGVDYSPTGFMTSGISYSFEKYSTLQRSRQANPPPDPQFTDARRDWTTDMDEHVHTWSANLDFPHIAPKTGLRFAFDYITDNAQYIYGLAPDTTLPAVRQLPEVNNKFSLFNIDLRYSLSRKVGFGAGYRLDHFDTNDFALTPDFGGTPGLPLQPAMPTYVNIMYQWRPYDVHTGFVRLFYNF